LMNIGSGEEVSIRDLAFLVADVVGYQGEIAFDATRPDGAPRKLLDSTGLRGLGWSPKIDLRSGLLDLYQRWTRDMMVAAQ
jgi:GDP-L-fucose synthase